MSKNWKKKRIVTPDLKNHHSLILFNNYCRSRTQTFINLLIDRLILKAWEHVSGYFIPRCWKIVFIMLLYLHFPFSEATWGVTVIVFTNGLGDSDSDSDRGFSNFKRYASLYSPSNYRYVVGILFIFDMVTFPGKEKNLNSHLLNTGEKIDLVSHPDYCRQVGKYTYLYF